MKKVLLALVMVAFLATVALGDAEWGNTTWVGYTWATKTPTASPIPVKMKIVRWADITFCDDNDKELVLVQTGEHQWEDCICLNLCVNFQGINIKAEYVDNGTIKFLKDGKKYVSLTEDGTKNYKENSTTLTVNTLALTGNLNDLTLCVKLTKVDPQGVQATFGQTIQIGQVNLTMWPSTAP
jgi:hypothetical protein